ncbi:MAG: hypothetical protein AAF413_02255 [Patescibacteria group bacterium]
MNDLVDKIFDVSLRSAEADVVRIFEIGSLSDLVPYVEAEKVRQKFVEQGAEVRQISNQAPEDWTEVDGMPDLVDVSVIDNDVLEISTEILIFGDTVAFYRADGFYHEFRDELTASMIKQIFDALEDKYE